MRAFWAGEPVTDVGRRLAQAAPGAMRAVRFAGKAVGWGGVVLSGFDAAESIVDGRWGDAAASAASGVGGYLLLTGTLAPVGAVLVAGALLYEHRDWIAERVTSLARSARDGVGAVIERTRERVGAAADGARAALDEAADWAADKVGGAVQDIGDAFGQVGRLIGP